jgi:hypothetical protein
MRAFLITDQGLALLLKAAAEVALETQSVPDKTDFFSEEDIEILLNNGAITAVLDMQEVSNSPGGDHDVH